MSDLSQPPPNALPPDADEAKSGVSSGRAEPFAWPTPPFANYPAPASQIAPEPCEIESLNGQVLSGRMMVFDPAAAAVQVQVPPSRTTMPLRFVQFRRMTLTRALPPLPPGNAAALAGSLQGQQVPYRVRFQVGADVQGKTVGHVEHEAGLFVFEPVDAGGAVRRSFFPRRVVRNFDLGERIGKVLVEQHAATSGDVERAAREQQAMRGQRLGDILLTRHVVTAEQLLLAIEQQARMPMVRIGEALVALGFVSEAQLADALVQQKQDRTVPLGELLVRTGTITRSHLQLALARKMGYPTVDIGSFPAEAEALGRVTYAVASRLQALPLMVRNGRLIVAFEDPTRARAIDELEFAAGCKVVPVLASGGSVGQAVDAAYQKMGAEVWHQGLSDSGGDSAPDGDGPDATRLLASLEQSSVEADDDRQIEQSDNSLVRLINTMILEAHQQGVSDVHIECQPGREKVRIRFRRDGLLKPYLELPHTYRSAIIARIKIMCDLDISERRKPQDGKISFGRFVQGSRLELRVATIPTVGGLEDAVLRLLNSARPIALDDLGLSPRNLAVVKELVQRPYGMFLCVGPTGSGKTTTLHSALGYINVPERKIWTAEDPVEITQPGLRQVQVNPKIDFSFARALRAFLRADPDVIMVGEVRDKETAQIAVESSLTGHLVLSTLHTNTAPETVTRLLDMGMDPFNFADALLGVLGQRLVRRHCQHCRTVRQATAGEVEELLGDYLNSFEPEDRPSPDVVLLEWKSRFGQDGRLMHHHSSGCDKCAHAGFRGRAGIHELMTVSRRMRHLIQTGARPDEIQRAAMADGMRTLRQDGIEKVLAGVVSIEEVRANSNQ